MRIFLVPLAITLCLVTSCTSAKEQEAAGQATTEQRPPGAEIVDVKYRGQVDLAPFNCEWVTRSSVVGRLCYDSKERYVIVDLGGTYYHYCEVPPEIVSDWHKADSMGRYYNAEVKGRFDLVNLILINAN